MTNLLIVSENKEFAEDLSSQISFFDENFAVFSPDDTEDSIDIILIDEDKNTIEYYREKYKRVPLIFLTSDEDFYADDIYKIIKKPFVLNDLLITLSSCLNLVENTQDGYIRFNNYELRPIKKEILCVRTGKIVKLTEKEVAIIKYLYKASGRLVYKNELLEDVWNYNSEVATHTLETHIYRLRQKVEKGDKRSKFIITRDGGYLLKP